MIKERMQEMFNELRDQWLFDNAEPMKQLDNCGGKWVHINCGYSDDDFEEATNYAKSEMQTAFDEALAEENFSHVAAVIIAARDSLSIQKQEAYA